MATESVPFPTSTAARQAPANPDFARSDTPPGYGMPGTATMPSGAGLSPATSDRPMSDAARDTAAHADDLIGRIAQSAHETIDRLAETAAPHVNRLQENLSGEVLHQRADQVRDLGDEWTESLRSTVRENPLAAVGVALAVGLLIARLSR